MAFAMVVLLMWKSGTLPAREFLETGEEAHVRVVPVLFSSPPTAALADARKLAKKRAPSVRAFKPSFFFF